MLAYVPTGEIEIEPRGERQAPLRFRHGARAPYAIRWYGITSLFGHFRNFIASAIASESVDARDWMRAEAPSELLATIARALRGDASASTLVDALGRPLWIDFVADTGDDRDVSLAVGKMLSAAYSVREQGAARSLPRGDVLVFGGDTAYPVATAFEIDRRLVAPWNEAIAENAPSHDPRVVMGIPGNHDWYDGLDGFARLFRIAGDDAKRQSRIEADHVRASLAPKAHPKLARRAGLVAKQLHLDEVSGFALLLANAGKLAKAFFGGVGVARRKRLTLMGYEAVQQASYWLLPLAKGLELWGVDRQLGRLDFRQRRFFQHARRATPEARVVFVAPDPAIAFGEAHDPGQRMLDACALRLDQDRVFYLTGDVHHYERRVLGESLHVIAGGGGAFLHGTRIAPLKDAPAACAYPDAKTSARLALQAPFKLMAGGAGLLVHVALGVVASIELASGAPKSTALLASLGLALVLYGIANHKRAHPRLVATVVVPYALVLGAAPMLLHAALPRLHWLFLNTTAIIVAYAFLGALTFGLFLATIALLGLEQQQAFTVLAHPGFKHFVRMCVHPSGRIEAWAIGKDDPLAPGPPVVIDQFMWGDEGQPTTKAP